MVYRLLHTWLRWLYPPVCALCGAEGESGLDLCPGCLADLPRNDSCCERCALPLPSGLDSRVCGDCQRDSPPFDRCLSPLIYQTPVRELIGRFKYRADLGAGRLLAEIFGQYLRQHLEVKPMVLVPVPLHPERLRERGFNQAMELARVLGHRLGIPVSTDTCRRVKATAPQSRLDQRARRSNVYGAFAVQRTPIAPHLALVDDVMTTGSTAGELARLLKRHGAERVDVWTCARRP